MAILLPENQQNVLRPFTNHPPSVWGCTFASFPSHDSELESYNKKVEVLGEQVKDLLKQSPKQLSDNIELINSLCRLGVSYHFKNEIEEQMDKIFSSVSQIDFDDNDYDLNTLGLLFRVLRQHGYKMSCDVFKKFKESHGGFKKSILNDVKGLLSLYEACHLSVHGEDILDEALAFTRQHLEILAEKSAPHLSKHIRNALFRSCHNTIERIDTLNYLSFYEAEESKNESLLKFAKLDFNRVQLVHRKELASVSRWWKELNIMGNLPYTRERIPESHLWAVGNLFEPEFGHCRVQYSKYVLLTAVLDDTFDEYGTFDELSHFTAALDRFTADAGNDLPEYMQFLYKVLRKVFEGGEENGSERGSYKLSYGREMYKELARGYMTETEWSYKGFMPTFDEFMSITGNITSVFDLLFSAFIFGVDEVGIKEIVWVRNNPKLVLKAKFFARLWDDVSSRKDELKSEAAISSVVCYMKEHGVSHEKALEEINEMFANGWKDLNEELMKRPRTIPKILDRFCINYSRMSDFTYRGGVDLFTCGSSAKDYIKALFVDPQPI